MTTVTTRAMPRAVAFALDLALGRKSADAFLSSKVTHVKIVGSRGFNARAGFQLVCKELQRVTQYEFAPDPDAFPEWFFEDLARAQNLPSRLSVNVQAQHVHAGCVPGLIALVSLALWDDENSELIVQLDGNVELGARAVLTLGYVAMQRHAANAALYFNQCFGAEEHVSHALRWIEENAISTLFLFRKNGTGKKQKASVERYPLIDLCGAGVHPPIEIVCSADLSGPLTPPAPYVVLDVTRVPFASEDERQQQPPPPPVALLHLMRSPETETVRLTGVLSAGEDFAFLAGCRARVLVLNHLGLTLEHVQRLGDRLQVTKEATQDLEFDLINISMLRLMRISMRDNQQAFKRDLGSLQNFVRRLPATKPVETEEKTHHSYVDVTGCGVRLAPGDAKQTVPKRLFLKGGKIINKSWVLADFDGGQPIPGLEPAEMAVLEPLPLRLDPDDTRSRRMRFDDDDDEDLHELADLLKEEEEPEPDAFRAFFDEPIAGRVCRLVQARRCKGCGKWRFG